MKRLIPLAVAICIVAALFAVPSSASGEVFVAAGNTVLPLTDAMPIKSGGVWYIDYQCFTKGNLKVSSSYNAADGMLVLYTWDTTLVFDMKSKTAYTTGDGAKYKQSAFVSHGTVFVPAQFTAHTLALEYTFFTDFPLIRIKNSESIPNNMFIYIAEEIIPDIRDAYNMSKNNAPQNKPVEDDKDMPDTGNHRIRLTFNITNGKNLDKIVSALQKYNYKATFFVRGSVVHDNADSLRRAAALGHNFGLLGDAGDADFSGTQEDMISALSRANDKLFKATRMKTRLVRISSGSRNILNVEKRDSLAQNGYRLWDYNVNPQGNNNSATRIYNNAVSLLSKRNDTAVLVLDDSDAAYSALGRILSYISSKSYSVRQISLPDTPVNQLGENR